MDSVWSRIFRGIALAADGLADLSYGGEHAESPADEAAGAASTSPQQAAVTAFLGDIARKLAAVSAPTGAAELFGEDGGDYVTGHEELAASMGVTEAGPEDGDDPFAAIARALPEPSEPDDSVIPESENGIRLLPCPELDRQKKESRRRAKFREDPVQAMSAISYWLLHLTEQPLRAEDWTHSIECIPGSASTRFAKALGLGMSELQLYATYYDECLRALQRGKDKAVQLAAGLSEVHDLTSTQINAGCLLDADRIGRILFVLGDRPDVEALTSAPPPSGDVRYLGPDHIEGAPGSVQAPAEGVCDELLTIEELAAMYPIEDDQEISSPS